jgi:ATP-dependent DNA ligase
MARHGRNRTGDFAAIADAMRELPGDAVLDGETVAHCADGLPDFHRALSREGQPSWRPTTRIFGRCRS